MSTPETHLAAFFRAATEAEADRHLDALVSSLKPAMEQVITRRGFKGIDAEDALGDARLLLISRLRKLREVSSERAITNPVGYARQIASSVCADRLKATHPRRANVQRRLIHLLSNQTGQSGFALWTGSSGERWCGFAVWKQETVRAGRPFHGNPQEIAWEALPGEDPKAANPAILMAALFRWAGGPVLLDDLVSVLAVLWDEVDPAQAVPRHETGEGTLELIPDPAPAVEELVLDLEDGEGSLRLLRSTWAEIEQLSKRQCSALLLNLRDQVGGNSLALFKASGIATYRKMAEVLGMQVEAFLALVPELPLDDLRIAGLLGCDRQGVINLRKSARDRLARRLKLTWRKKSPPDSAR